MYLLLAVFPGIAAVVSLCGLVANPTNVVNHIKEFSGILPPGSWDLFKSELDELVKQGVGSLTFAAVFGMLVAFWSARSAMAALMTATNIAYGEREKRALFQQVVLSLAFTVGTIGAFLIVVGFGVAIPRLLLMAGISEWVRWLAAPLRAGIIWAMGSLGFAIIYRYGPARQLARWRWVTWGSSIAATLWLLASALFAFYVQKVGSYGKLYGALSSVIVLLVWFYLSSFLLVLGALVNAEMERQTARDTTVGSEAPLGERGAYVADTIGETSEDA